MAEIKGVDICIEAPGKALINGYRAVNRKGKVSLAHRFAWEDEYGEIPLKHHIHHTCGNRLCINIAHLELLTASEHQSLHYADREYLHMDKRTHCLQGHLLEGRNSKQRFCLVCKRLKGRIWASNKRRELQNA